MYPSQAGEIHVPPGATSGENLVPLLCPGGGDDFRDDYAALEGDANDKSNVFFAYDGIMRVLAGKRNAGLSGVLPFWGDVTLT